MAGGLSSQGRTIPAAAAVALSHPRGGARGWAHPHWTGQQLRIVTLLGCQAAVGGSQQRGKVGEEEGASRHGVAVGSCGFGIGLREFESRQLLDTLGKAVWEGMVEMSSAAWPAAAGLQSKLPACRPAGRPACRPNCRTAVRQFGRKNTPRPTSSHQLGCHPIGWVLCLMLQQAALSSRQCLMAWEAEGEMSQVSLIINRACSCARERCQAYATSGLPNIGSHWGGTHFTQAARVTAGRPPDR